MVLSSPFLFVSCPECHSSISSPLNFTLYAPTICFALRGPRNNRSSECEIRKRLWRFRVHFAVSPARNPLSLTKNHPKSDFYLLNSKKCITFAPESPTPGFRGREVSPLGKPIYLTKHPSRGFQDILKRRLLALCSDSMKLRNFQLYAGLSNDRCPTGYRLSLCAYLVRLLRIYACAHAYLNYVAREYIYIRRGLRVVGLIQWAMRRPHRVERQQSESTFFVCLYESN